ncbi:MAG: response regulator [Desulfopila sp.]|jgi:signal transduction histidine kinase|nr:response regulator [Desulfopila sp.]
MAELATLLVVDDEEALLSLCSRRLQKLNYTVYAAGSGKEALAILKERKIDLLITDFHMPGMDGCETIHNAKEIDEFIQCIVITGFSDLKTAIHVMGAGAFDYLQKPIDFIELDVAIKKGLEKRKLIRDNANKQMQLDEYRTQLEKLVQERTLALTAANKQLQKEIEERKILEHSLREAKRIADEANKAKSEFLANMSHEIRTPMTSAIGLLNLVLESDLQPKQKAYLEMARISSMVMHNLLNDILDFSKIEAGRLNLESISFSPAAIIESVIDLQHLQAEEKSIRIFWPGGEYLPETVKGDPNGLRQILLNLVANAVKYTHYGDITINCTQVDDHNSSGHNHVSLHFSVQDTGIGIEKEKISMIFEAFTQVDSSTTRKFGGVGLGLNICSKLVSLMGGRIWVESEPGRGSTFHFICRFEKVSATKKRLSRLSPAALPKEQQQKPDSPSILVVEDDQTNQWLIQEILEQQGYTVVNASNGESALKKLQKTNFDMVLLDLQLPKLSGYEVVRQLRDLEKLDGMQVHQRLPVIALTGFAGEEERQRCLDAGMDGFIAKPFVLAHLQAKIENILKKRPRKKEKSHDRTDLALHQLPLEDTVFDENEALKRASGNRELVEKRVALFLQKAPLILEMLENTGLNLDNELLVERKIQNLKDMAMEIGAVNFADELFSLLMWIRKKEYHEENVIDTDNLKIEFELFRNTQTMHAKNR